MNKKLLLLTIAAVISGVFAIFIVSYALALPAMSQLAAVGSLSEKTLQNTSVMQSQHLFGEISNINSNLLNTSVVNQKNASANIKVQNTQNLGQIAGHRKQLMKQLMKTDPRLFNALAMKKATSATLPSAVQMEVEQSITITGKISTVVIDDFTNKKSSYEYYIQTPQQKYSFYPTSETPILSGTTVTVTGYALDDQISVNTQLNPLVISKRNKPITPKDIPAPRTDTVGDQRTLVLLIKASPGDAEPFTPVQGQDLVFNSQFQNFMKEQSYNKISFSGDVFGWTAVNSTIDPRGCMLWLPISDIVDTYKINLANYDRIVYLLNGALGGCSYIGKSDLLVNGISYKVSQSSVGTLNYDRPSQWGYGNEPFAWTNLDYGLSHELGHALGVMHANSWICTGGQILYGDCLHSEYGNPFDTMGNGYGFSLHYNAYFKEQLGWIPSEQMIMIDHSGSYTINPLEFVDGVKLATVNILNNTITPYTIEFRKSTGFDSELDTQNANGIFINRIQSTSVPATELLNMGSSIVHPTLSLPSASSSVYSFVDASRGITIGPVLNVSTSSISFYVDIQPLTCQRYIPIGDATYSSSVSAGSSGYVSITIRNSDYYGCGPSNFDIVPVSSPLWQYTFYSTTDLVIQPDDSGYKIMNFTVPTNTLPGSYTLNIDVINKTSGLKKTVSVTIQVTEALTITNINPTSGPSGTPITITGTGFDPLDNGVYINGTNGWTIIQTLPSSDGKILYTIPSTIRTCVDPQCTSVHSISTPDGDYTIAISVNGFWASANFHVGTIPTITLTATPNPVTLGQSTTISWSATNATSCSSNTPYKGGYPIKFPVVWRTPALSGSFIWPVSSNAKIALGSGLNSITLYLTCTGQGGTASSSLLIQAIPAVTTTTLKIAPFSGGILLSLSGLPSMTYELLYSINLLGGPWIHLANITTDQTGHGSYSDVNSGGSRFYKISDVAPPTSAQMSTPTSSSYLSSPAPSSSPSPTSSPTPSPSPTPTLTPTPAPSSTPTPSPTPTQTPIYSPSPTPSSTPTSSPSSSPEAMSNGNNQIL
jgi:hypothetical protein